MDFILHLGRGFFGIAVFLAIAVALSENRRAISWRLIATGVALQFTFAALVLYFAPARIVIEWIGSRFVDLLGFTNAGVEMLFGSLADKSKHGVLFAIQVLPSIIFFSAFSSLLYYLGILQKIVFVFAWVMSKTMRLSGAETLSASANIFLGQTEAPFLIKPYLPTMTRSEMLTIMTGGMATIAGAVMIAYIAFLGGDDPQQQVLFATHLITASVINAPAGLMLSKILLPQTEPVSTDLNVSKERIGSNLVDAVCVGTTDGLKLAVNVGAMLIAFTALIAMLNALLGWFGSPHDLVIGGATLVHYPGLNAWIREVTDGAFQSFSLELLFGLVYAPIAWLLGIDLGHLLQSGALLGTRTVLNEFISFSQLAGLKSSGALTDARTIIILTYAMCGFANIVSIGIQIGGIGALAPNQRSNLAQLGVKAMIGGTLACYLSACVAGILT
ncbi:NupC/NupG family nucleoside CNT transporter [Opitutus terrae]|uniref:Na+ dependent nucleoside transporter domain protein n=1 Tax=Opitutus terrae (strain DSM 11246 / JCM 15787 / PB90-1) TaxID=452637 RepID=B1ZZX7_OPITP|nr:nucleoside transporter C-terminal domain-containing protein [Opitutus terrae]ACB77313.1 Na+ dependent nucleoside transporter domain protein [Opitutus terrae PB90-1]